MWKFRIGDVVKHQHVENLVGVVVGCKYGCEIDNEYPDDIATYQISWVIVPEEEEMYIGQEHQEVLTRISKMEYHVS